jgi:hypothetical protein
VLDGRNKCGIKGTEGAKYNTAKSSADIGDYNPRINGNKSKGKKIKINQKMEKK